MRRERKRGNAIRILREYVGTLLPPSYDDILWRGGEKGCTFAHVPSSPVLLCIESRPAYPKKFESSLVQAFSLSPKVGAF